MRQTVYIHLRDIAADAPLAYRVDGAATGATSHAPLAEIAAEAAGARVVVLVPCAPIRFLDVELPVRSRSRALVAAPYACEDRLAEDVDKLHFAHLARSDEHHHAFAVIAHGRMEAWFARFAEVGLRPDAMIPEVLCLPEPADGEWVVHRDDDDGRLLVRQSRNAGVVTQVGNLPTLLALAGEQAPQQVRLIQRGDHADLEVPDGVSVSRQPEFGELLDVLVRYLPDGEHADLLQGVYAPQSNASRHLRPWRTAAILATTALLLSLAYQVTETLRLQGQADAQQAANVERFKRAFPGYNDVRHQQLTSFLGAEMRSAEGGDDAASLLPLLDSYVQAAQTAKGLSLRGMQWRDNALLLSLRGESLSDLEALRTWYQQQQGVSFEVQNADAGSDGVQIRVRLRRS
ncbi:type II secretion system protein GspL [Algiphilus sp.]|uniref:type II secretion system protein GspL n=1 Tax=Algiphilus sp. TaxID=1872431 RepID=UPI0025BCF53B|nr:type II secretion system protein GspL [Algiphilus sp.]MCK5770814.1 hypothetical protein [Algiphilus sp.]